MKQPRKKEVRPRRISEITPTVDSVVHNVCNWHDGSSKTAKFNAPSNSQLLHSIPSALTRSSFSQLYARKMPNSAMRLSPACLPLLHAIQIPTPTQSRDCRRICSHHFCM